MRALRPIALAALLLLVAACSVATSPSSSTSVDPSAQPSAGTSASADPQHTPSAPGPMSPPPGYVYATPKPLGPLDGTRWILATIDGKPADGGRLTASFNAGLINGEDDCNDYGGFYSLDGDTLTLTGVYESLVGCMNEGAGASISDFGQAHVVRDGPTLTVTNPRRTLVFEQMDGLAGTTWMIEKVDGVEAPAPTPDPADAAAARPSGVSFDATRTGDKGGVHGWIGCRSFEGSYTEGESGALEAAVTAGEKDLHDCGPGESELADAVLAALSAATRVSFDDGDLTKRIARLTSADGHHEIVLFTPIFAAPTPDPAETPVPIRVPATMTPTENVNGELLGKLPPNWSSNSTPPPQPAALVIVEDYQSPESKAIAQEIIPRLAEEFGGSGKLMMIFVVNDALGPESAQAYVAAKCATNQGLRFPYRDYLFANQGATPNTGAFDRPHLMAIGNVVGVNPFVLTNCLDNPDSQLDSMREQAQGWNKRTGSDGSPSLFFGSTKVPGPMTYESVRDFVVKVLDGSVKTEPYRAK